MQKAENTPVNEELMEEQIKKAQQPNVDVKGENEPILKQEEIAVEASNQESTFSDQEATNSPTIIDHKSEDPKNDSTIASNELEPNHEVLEKAVEEPTGLKKTWLLAKSLWKKNISSLVQVIAKPYI